LLNVPASTTRTKACIAENLSMKESCSGKGRQRAVCLAGRINDRPALKKEDGSVMGRDEKRRAAAG
jgi:hypothetical protein